MRPIKGLLFAAALVVTAGTASTQAEEAGAASEESLGGYLDKGLDTLEWGVLLEAEAAYANTKGDTESTSQSDIILATFEFVLDAAITDWMAGHVGFLWEQYDTEPIALDEGYIVLGGEPAYGFFTQVGKFYLPFGNFETAFISDPLTLELAEINKSTAMVGWGNEVMNISAGAFRGDVKKGATLDEGDPVISDFYAAASFSLIEELEFGAYWLSDLMETDGLLLTGEDIAQDANYEKTGGAGAYANVYVGPVMLNGEFVSAVGDYEFIPGEKYRPMAFNLEGSYTFAGKYTAGLKYERSKDLYATRPSIGAFADKFADHVYGAVFSYGFHENAAIGIEYARLDGIDVEENGRNNDTADVVTVQLALEF